MKRSWQESSLWILCRTTFEEWNADNAARLAAALAYYTIFSVAPLLVIVVAVAGLFYGREAAQGQLTHELERYVTNPDAVDLIQTVIMNARVPETSAMATLVGFGLLLWGAAGVFGELRNALNNIWDVPPRTTFGIRSFLLDRLLPLVMVVISGFLLVASLLASAALGAATNLLDVYLPGTAANSGAINFWFLFVVTFLVFALLYKYVPEVPIYWVDVWPGALATALLFSLGRLLIGWYLAHTSVATAYGAAGSIVLVLLYTYYSAQVFYLGAEFTQVYGRTYGTRRDEHQLIEQPIPASPQQTIQDPSGTIVPAPTTPGAIPPDDTPIQQIEDATAAPTAASVRRRSLQRVARPAAQAGAALGVIALLSVVNLVMAPLRREKKPA
jgi:membrane protein